MLFSINPFILFLKGNAKCLREEGRSMRHRSDAEIWQNLRDAGCSETMIQEFFSCSQKDEKDKQVTMLEAHRKKLLEDVHDKEKKISCLDYLMFQMNRE